MTDQDELIEDPSEEEFIELVIPDEIPVLPAKDVVPFPSIMMSLYVGRPGSISAVEAAEENDDLIFIVSQISSENENPGSKDLYKVGVVGNIARTLKLPDGRLKVLIQGLVRAQVLEWGKDGATITAHVEELHSLEIEDDDPRVVELDESIRNNLQVLVEHEHLPEEMLLVTEEIDDPGVLSDVIVAHYRLENNYSQSILEELDPLKRLEITDKIIKDDLAQFVVSENIRDKIHDELSKGQRDYYLREQLKQIHRELGESEPGSEDLEELKKKISIKFLPEHAFNEAEKQLKRLERMPTESSEYALLRTYLEWVTDLPWKDSSRDRLDLKRVLSVLNEDHYGLDKIKDRILEYLSVRKLNKDTRGPILCFVGPPGVGKTSLGSSIARAINRKFVRISLGGVRDEAEIRGHRRTYVGALPGKIVQSLKQAGKNNPVIVLDELDKVGADFRGDPAAALLEVLDPNQNNQFSDHYLGVPFDLSKVLFIATANTTDTIPDALLDRLEVIRLSGYTTDEKIKIAKRYLVPRQLKENGLAQSKLGFGDKVLRFVIERYTREAGVRNLEREIGSLCRKVARQYAETKSIPSRLTVEFVQRVLGVTRFDPEHTDDEADIGLARGLAWTPLGGEVMPVEVSTAPGAGGLAQTGHLGNVMQESAQAAMFFTRANAQALGIDASFYKKLDVHFHVPSGATPKDGPSAGVTIVTALVSALTKRKVVSDLAMTGEITLRGNVLAVGGIKEKCLAALRYGIKTIVIPAENMKDLEEIPAPQRRQLTFIPVKHVTEVLAIALEKKTTRRGEKATPKRHKTVKARA